MILQYLQMPHCIPGVLSYCNAYGLHTPVTNSFIGGCQPHRRHSVVSRVYLFLTSCITFPSVSLGFLVRRGRRGGGRCGRRLLPTDMYFTRDINWYLPFGLELKETRAKQHASCYFLQHFWTGGKGGGPSSCMEHTFSVSRDYGRDRTKCQCDISPFLRLFFIYKW